MSIRILLVDDDEDDFVIARDLIAEIPGGDFAVEWESSFDAGMEAWRTRPFDMILLDYRLGARSGIDFLVAVRESGAQIPVIVLTGQGDREIDVAAMTAGAADYLVKGELSSAILDRAIRYALSLAQLNQRFHEEHKRLTQIERLSSIGMLAAGIVHEVNNPLAGVKGLVTALDDETLPSHKRKEYIAAIRDGLTRMGETIRGLLDLAREQPLSMTELELSDVVRSCMRLVGMQLRDKGLQSEVQVAPGERVMGDRSRLMQALINLLLNASHATPSGGKITVSTVTRPGQIGLAVRDTGSGIPSEISQRVLEPFFTTKPIGQGTGLGLAIVNSIVKAHGGTLEIASEKDQGATVTLWLRGVASG